MRINIIRLFLFNLLLILGATANAQNNLPTVFEIKTDTSQWQDINNQYWQILPDNTNKLTIADVSQQPLDSNFYSIVSKKYDSSSVTQTYWLRLRLKNVMSKNAEVSLNSSADMSDYYIYTNGIVQHYLSGKISTWSKKDGFKKANATPLLLHPQEEIIVYERAYNEIATSIQADLKIRLFDTDKLQKSEFKDYENKYVDSSSIHLGFLCGIFFLAAIFNFLIYWQIKDKVYLYFSLFLLFISLQYHPSFSTRSLLDTYVLFNFFTGISSLWIPCFLFFIRYYFEIPKKFPRWDKTLIIASIIFTCLFLLLAFSFHIENIRYIGFASAIFMVIYYVSIFITVIIGIRRPSEARKIFLIAMTPFILAFFFIIVFVFLIYRSLDLDWNLINYIMGGAIAWAVVVFSSFLFKRYSEQQKQLVHEQLEKEKLLTEKEKERNEFIEEQKIYLEKQVLNRTSQLKQSLEELKSTQSQLIQSEKMASLGELTAGIAHEIQNPLNFVNNFSEVNKELLTEMNEEIDKENFSEVKAIAKDVIDNEEKINHHGKRADAIVKGMLQHSRQTSGAKESTDINALCDEYLRLSYHGLRAKDKSFNADFKTDFDESLSADEAGIGSINVVPQDIGRVLINLFGNAFYAVNEKKNASTSSAEQNLPPGQAGYQPLVLVQTKKENNSVRITVSDNGNGVPQNIIDKIFQPFFTTKPTGQGTGLGLSLAYDIITKEHNGTIKAESKEGEGTKFIIQLPIA